MMRSAAATAALMGIIALPATAQVDLLWTGDFEPGCLAFTGLRDPVVRIAPQYPPEAVEQEVEGDVLVDILVDTDGAPATVRIVAAEPTGFFEQSTVRAVARWLWVPLIVASDPCSFWTGAEVRYRLAR
jgi:TonB family protein